jgi:CPA2 family monovalent cation:H+ antiporter-2
VRRPPWPAEVAWLGFGPVLWTTLLVTGVKVVAFVALMLVVGRRVIPWILHYVAHTGQRELFRLSVLSIALGVAWGSAMFFGVSFALGAFFAGMVMAGSSLSAQAMKDTLPLRDAFAVLFFVSVGMLFNPAIIWEAPAVW